MKTRGTLALVLALASLVGTARADLIIYNSLDQTPNAGAGGIPSGNPSADSFSTSGTAYSLDDVQLFLEKGSSVGTGSVTVSLLSDSNKSPGTSLTTLGTVTASSLSTTASVVDLSSFTPYALATNTRYWIELSASATNNVDWLYTSASNGTGVSGEYTYSFGEVLSNSQGPFQMKLTVATAAVPEPSPLLLIGVAGLVGLVVWLSRRSVARRGALPAAA